MPKTYLYSFHVHIRFYFFGIFFLPQNVRDRNEYIFYILYRKDVLKKSWYRIGVRCIRYRNIIMRPLQDTLKYFCPHSLGFLKF